MRNCPHSGADSQGWLETGGFCVGDQPPAPCEGDASPLVCCRRIGLSQRHNLPWRFDLRASRSVNRRAQGDRRPGLNQALNP